MTRDSARASQQRQEGALLTEGKDRDRKLNENRLDIPVLALLTEGKDRDRKLNENRSGRRQTNFSV